MLSQQEFDAYTSDMTADQRSAISAVRSLLLSSGFAFEEKIDEGKWFGGMITYNLDETFVYALGPRAGGATSFHMMPYYSSKELQERHGPALKKLLSGKSCIQFKSMDQVPNGVLEDIISTSQTSTDALKAYMESRKKPKAKAGAA